jgi:cytochrome c553
MTEPRSDGNVKGGMMHKGILVGLLSISVVLLFGSAALAFHDAGVAYCGGCHTMHNSENGQPIDPDHLNGNQYLLKLDTPSDVCLSCHATSHGAVLGTDPLNPPPELGGGNFVFLLEDNINDGHSGGSHPILGYASGHNLDAPAYGVGPDAVLTNAPGGNYPAEAMGCTSCHDPHGNTNLRLLYGVGPIQGGLYIFTNPAPTGEVMSYNSPGETNSNHTAYQSGWSAWCANCHGNFHSANNPEALIHPSGVALGGIATTYNLYNGTSDPYGGSQATAYLAAVPFEDLAVTLNSTAGPTATSKVTCMTCHRAHATSAQNAGRWDFNVTYLDDDGVASGSYAIPNPYNDPSQRSLCNKCHLKDLNDELVTP